MDAWMIELKKQSASVVGATCNGITFCWNCLHFDKRQENLTMLKQT